MVIMSKPRSGAVRLFLAVLLGLLVLSCGADATAGDDVDGPLVQESDAASTAALDTESTGVDTSEDTVDDAAGDTENEPVSTPQVGVPAEALANGGETEPVEGIVAGTDSSTPVDPGQPDAAMQATLTEFAELYLGYDYRGDESARTDRFRRLVTPVLLDQLSTPIPPTLREQFDAERRVTEATLLELTPLDDGLFALNMALSTITASGSHDDVRLLIVAVNAEQLVSDVR